MFTKYRRQLKFLTFAAGIIVSYSLFGILQEKIFKSKYGAEKEEFTFAVAFVAIQTVVLMAFAKTAIFIRSTEKNLTHQKFYFAVGLFYVLAMVTSNLALKWIPYSAQVVVKASKPIFVMILSFLVARKSYSIQRYFFILLMVLGVAGFIFNKDLAQGKDEKKLFGYIIIGISLVFDGLTGAAQDKMRADSRPTTLNFIFYVNAWSSLVLITLMALNGEGRDLIDFTVKHPEVLWELSLAVVCGTSGQLFLSAMIVEFGPLPVSIVTTFRKFLSVLISAVIFRTPLSLQQWITAGVIFVALLLDSIFGKKHKSNEESPITESQESSEEFRASVDIYPARIDLGEILGNKEKL